MRNNLQLEMSLIELSRTCYVLNSYGIENVFHISTFGGRRVANWLKEAYISLSLPLLLSLALTQVDSVA